MVDAVEEQALVLRALAQVGGAKQCLGDGEAGACVPIVTQIGPQPQKTLSRHRRGGAVHGFVRIEGSSQVVTASPLEG